MKEKKVFYNIISIEDFEKLTEMERINFYIKNNVYSKNFWTKGEISNLNIDTFYKHYSVNDTVLDEIINIYLESKRAYWETDYDFNLINIELELSIDKESKIKALKKYYKIYKKQLKKNPLYYFFFLPDSEIKELILFDAFNDIIKYEIKENTVIINDHITGGIYDFEIYDVFKNWSEIEKKNKVICYIKKELDKLDKGKNDKKPLKFSSFFKAAKFGGEVKFVTDEIKQKFKDESNKKTAILIHLLREKKLLEKSAMKVNIKFVRSLKNQPNLLETSAINGYLNPNDNERNLGNESDADYNDVKNRLDMIFKFYKLKF